MFIFSCILFFFSLWLFCFNVDWAIHDGIKDILCLLFWMCMMDVIEKDTIFWMWLSVWYRFDFHFQVFIYFVLCLKIVVFAWLCFKLIFWLLAFGFYIWFTSDLFWESSKKLIQFCYWWWQMLSVLGLSFFVLRDIHLSVCVSSLYKFSIIFSISL